MYFVVNDCTKVVKTVIDMCLDGRGYYTGGVASPLSPRLESLMFSPPVPSLDHCPSDEIGIGALK
jgi:hypothetical protein